MDDIESELERFLARTPAVPPGTLGTQSGAPVSAPEAVPEEETPLDRFLREQDNAQVSAPAAPTPAPPASTAGDSDPTSAFEAFYQSIESAAPSADAEVPAGAEALETGQAKPGLIEAFTGGLERGAANVAATPYDLAGIAKEAMGDEQGAQEAYEAARRVEAYAGPKQYTWDDIHDGGSFAGWLAETFGEQAPIMATLFTGAGAGALSARLAGKMLLRRSVSRTAANVGMTVGGSAAGIGLETAGTGSELKGATGSYQPSTAVTAGAIKGLLEFYGPTKLIKGIQTPGTTLAGEAIKMAIREGATEGAQELTDAAARAYEDEKYSFWSRETWSRVTESTAGGFFVGGGIGAGGKAIGQALGADAQLRPGEQKDVTVTDEGFTFEKEESWMNPLTWLRRKFTKQSKVGQDAGLEPTDVVVEDYSEQGTLFGGVRKTWENTGINQDQVDAILDFEDAVTPRYFIEMPSSHFSLL